MKETLRIIWLVLLAAILLCGSVVLLCGWIGPLLTTIVADSASAVKQEDAVLATVESEQKIILLDPGHGGEDPGAIGVDGVLEKDLNLSTALRVRDLLVFSGYRVIMTRSDDRLLYDPSDSTSHKVQDLQNRLEYSKLYPNATFVSIHMNKFPDASCSGLQVYYSGNHEGSALLAEAIQGRYAEAMPTAKVRACKKATSSIFILHRIEIPAVLVECGFLSSPAENELLQSADYQKKLAAVIALALTENDTPQNSLPTGSQPTSK